MSEERALVKMILEGAHAYGWTVCGLGFMRTYIDDSARLHVWHPDLRIDGVSSIHTHPWHFTSMILSGELSNVRKVETAKGGTPFYVATITTGTGEGADDYAETKLTDVKQLEVLRAGESYKQNADEIHCTIATPGTVSMIRRQPTDHPSKARVFWLRGAQFVSSEAREATPDEVEKYSQHALEWWS